MTRQEIEDSKNRLASLILDREAKLKEHDYVSAKIADGRATADEYAEVIASKNRWAEEVNEAMAEMARLKDITPEDEGIDIGLGESNSNDARRGGNDHRFDSGADDNCGQI